MRTYYLLAATGETHEFNIKQLVDLFTDWASWTSFFKMSLGGPVASMTAIMQSGERYTYSVAQAPFEKF